MSHVPPTGRLEGPVLVVGAGRMGRTLAAALRAAGVDTRGPDGRGTTGDRAGTVVLAVPDAAIAAASALIAPGRVVGHLSGSSTLAPSLRTRRSACIL